MISFVFQSVYFLVLMLYLFVLFVSGRLHQIDIENCLSIGDAFTSDHAAAFPEGEVLSAAQSNE